MFQNHSHNVTTSLICLFECQQNLAYISAGYLGIIFIVATYLICRRLRSDKNRKKTSAQGRRREQRNRSTSQSSTWSSARGLNDSFDTDSITSSVYEHYGSKYNSTSTNHV